MKQLIIGEIPEEFDKTKHKIFNPYSFEDNTELENNIDVNDYDSILDLDKEYYRLLDQQSSAFILNYIKENTEYFNKRFNIDRGYIFWKILVYPWLIAVFQNALERYLQVEKFISSNNEVFRVDLVNNDFNWNFPNTESFHNHIYSIEYNEWLTSRIIEQFDLNYSINSINRKKEAKEEGMK